MNNISRMIIFFILAGSLFSASSAQAAEQVSGKFFYTAANIWVDSRSKIESTNYHKGDILLIGTRVKIKEVFDGSTSASEPLGTQQFDRFIRFDDETGQSYKLLFMPRHSKSGMTVWDLFKQYFAENNPKAKGGAFASLTAEEQKSVMAGEITVGMSKTAVLMAYGYPPSHKTSSLLLDKWTYWEKRSKIRTIYFSDNKVIPEPNEGAESQRTKTPSTTIRDESQQTKTLSPMEACIKTCNENTKRTTEQCFDSCNHSW